MKKPDSHAVLQFIRQNAMLLVMAVCMLGTLIWSLFGGKVSVDDILKFTPSNLWLTALLLLALYALKGLTAGIIYNVLVIATGLLYPLPLALMLNTAGTVICIMLPYFIGRRSKPDMVEHLLNKNARLRKWYNEQKGYSFFFSIFLRALGLSNELLGVFFGSLGVKPLSYLASSFIGIVPNMIFMTVLGNQLDDPINSTTLILGICMLAEMGITILVYILRRRHQNRLTADGSNGAAVNTTPAK